MIQTKYFCGPHHRRLHQQIAHRRRTRVPVAVTIEFTVGRQGELKYPKIINGLGKYCNQVVIDVIDNSPRWVPCLVRGKKVEVKYQLDISFKIAGQMPTKI
ncbi:MAG TPA: energy transducer TonB [Pedobacter sp.]|uniref:energy transducer TonB n=1 Tax=Pedobacter sp. TaxID=1411316 RepID=UPI002C831BD8|nr:energy transducer TonB [Pedobacter sp.]HMI03999.1 energy transducer TonB [Pedobacter sp.]